MKKEFINDLLIEMDNQALYLHKLYSKKKLRQSENFKIIDKDFIESLKVYEQSFHHQLLFLGNKGELLYWSDNYPNIPKNINIIPEEFYLKTGRDLLYEKELSQARYHQNGYDIRYSRYPDTQYLNYARKFNQLYIVISISFQDISESINYIDIVLSLFVLIYLLLLIFLNRYLANLIIKPIKDTIQYAKNFLSNLNYQLPYHDNVEEISRLQYTLNRVAKVIQKNVNELSNRKSQVETVIRNVSEGVLILDKSLKVLLCNRGLFSLLEIEPEVFRYKVDGKYYYELIRNNNLNNLIEQSFEKEIRIKQNIRLSKVEDVVLEVNCLTLPLKSGVVVLINNITEQYKLSQMKKSFVENVSHEFKTPLSIIKGYVETLMRLKTPELPEREKFLQRLHRNTERLSQLIHDLITINKLDEGKDYFRKDIINIIEIINSTIEALAIKADSKGINLINTIAEKEIILEGNHELLEAIFYNLVDNGITYTDNGGEVKVSYRGEEENAVFNVTDTGITIPKEHRERVFERFYRVDEGRSRKIGGTGLGLSIVKNSVLYHNGEVSCEANPAGRGSQFKIILPILKKTSKEDALKELDNTGKLKTNNAEKRGQQI